MLPDNKYIIVIIIVLILMAIGYFLYKKGYFVSSKTQENATPKKETYDHLIKEILDEQEENFNE
jgi:hypothetical protein